MNVKINLKYIIFVLLAISLSFIYFMNFSKNKPSEDLLIQTDNNTVKLQFTADGRTPDDWFTDFIMTDAFLSAIYGSLTSLTPNGLFVVDSEDSLLSEVMTNGGDPKEFYLTVKKGLFFEKDGQKYELTAEDVKFSFSIPLFLEEMDIFEKSDLLKIKGSEKIIPGEPYSDNKLAGITVLDKYKLKIEFKNPEPEIITLLSSYRYPIVSRQLYLNKKEGEVTPGLGRYTLVSTNKKSGEALLKRKVHKDGYPDFVKFVSGTKAQGDVLFRDMWGKLDSKYVKESLNTPYGTMGLLFNYEKYEVVKDSNFRKAIALAINRHELCAENKDIIPNNEALPLSYWGRIGIEEKQNRELAKELLKKVKDVPNPLKIEVFGSHENELKKSYYVKLHEQLKAIGLNPEFEVFNGSGKVQTPITMTHVSVPHRSPSLVFHFFAEGSCFRSTYPRSRENKQFEDLLNSLDSHYKDTEKLYYAKELSKHIYENNTFIPLWDIMGVYYYNKSKVKTIGNQPGGVRFDIWKVKLNSN